MTPDPARTEKSPVQTAPSALGRWWARHGLQAVGVLGAAGVSALVGYGLANSLLPLLAGRAAAAAEVGALVAALVALLVLPLGLWARVPALPWRTLLRPVPRSSQESAPPAAGADHNVVPLPVKGAAGLQRPSAQAAALQALSPQAVSPLAAAARQVSGTAALASAGGSLGAVAQPAGPSDLGGATDWAQLPATLSEPQRAVRDALTGAYTQQHFVAAADREWSRIRRHGEDAALLMVDIDRFNGINERHGQGCGDALLVEVTRQVSSTLRQYDLLARFGGGVLVVYLPHTDPMGALDVAERIRERVAALRISHEGHTVRSTVSVGVAGIGASHGTLDEVIAEAGTALRDAKAAGRNCVRAAPIPPRRGTPSSPQGVQRPFGPF